MRLTAIFLSNKCFFVFFLCSFSIIYEKEKCGKVKFNFALCIKNNPILILYIYIISIKPVSNIFENISSLKFTFRKQRNILSLGFLFKVKRIEQFCTDIA